MPTIASKPGTLWAYKQRGTSVEDHPESGLLPRGSPAIRGWWGPSSMKEEATVPANGGTRGGRAPRQGGGNGEFRQAGERSRGGRSSMRALAQALFLLGLLGLTLLLVLSVTGPAAALAAPRAPSGSWPQFRGDPSLSGVSSSNPPGGTVLYTVDATRYTGQPVGSPLANDYPYQASPSTDGSRVVVVLDNEALSFQASNGSYQWKSLLSGGTGSGPVVGSPLIANGLVYLAQDGGPNVLEALYLNNGTMAWQSASPGGGNPVSASVVESAGSLAVADLAGGFYWTSPSGPGLWSAPTTPARAQYFATPSFGTVAGVGPAWIVPDRGNRSLDGWTPAGTVLPGFPVSSAQPLDRLYSSAALVNLTVSTGTTSTWAIFGGEGGTGNPSHLYAVDVSSPSEGIFSLTIPALGTGDAGVRSTPAVVVTGGSASIYFADRAGTVSHVILNPAALRSPWSWAWNATTGGPIDASPVVVGGEVIVASEDGSVYGFDTATGAQAWKVVTGAPIYASPAVASGICWVVNSNGILTAIGGNGPSGSPGGGTPGGSGGNGGGANILSSGGLMLIALAIVAIFVVAVVAVFLLRKRGGRSGGSPRGSSSPPGGSGSGGVTPWASPPPSSPPPAQPPAAPPASGTSLSGRSRGPVVG